MRCCLRSRVQSPALLPAVLRLLQLADPLCSSPAPTIRAAACTGDRAAVDAWPPLAMAPPAASDAAAAASPLGPAFARLQLEQKERWQAAAARRSQLEALRAEAAAARQAAAEDGGEAGARALLAAQQAGLRAELACLERAAQEAEAAASAAAQRAAQAEEQRGRAAALQAEEAAVDEAVQALCCADGRVMRQWRQGTWRAQEAVETGVLAQRQPLLQLSRQLLEAQQRELAAFQAAADGACCGGDAQPAAACGGGAVAAAAQLLDPLAALKTEKHASAVVAAAQAELAELQPAEERWLAADAAAASKLAALQEAAAELEQQAVALQGEASGAEGGPTALQQLQEAAAAAEEGAALVAAARQALTEWSTSPAITAAPWVQRKSRRCIASHMDGMLACGSECAAGARHPASFFSPAQPTAGEGRTAEEWLRLLQDQQRAQRQREALTDGSNRRRLPAMS